MVHRAVPEVARARRPEHDPRRRRRRHAARPQGRRVREGRRGAGSLDDRQRGAPGHPEDPPALAGGRSDVLHADGRGHQGRDGGDDDRRPPPLPDAGGRRAPVPGDQRQRLGHEVEVRQPLRLPPLARGRHQPRRRPHALRQGRRGLRLRRRGQGLGRVAARPGRSRHRHGDRPDLRAPGADGGLRGPHGGGGRRDGRRLHHDDRQQGHHHGRPHGPDEAPGHRRQHRPLRQRDPGRLRAGEARTSGPTSSRRSTSTASRTATRSSCSPRAGC